MQIKKFEAPTIQEALDAIKRELGPEAIILQTKKNRRGFGLLNGASVEVTAAVSDRAIQKKSFSERKMPADRREEMSRLPASQQADILDRTVDRHLRRGKAAEATNAPKAERRYADIDSHEVRTHSAPLAMSTPSASALSTQETTSRALSASAVRTQSLEDEVKQLKRMLEELKIAQDEAPRSGVTAGVATQLTQSPVLIDVFEQLILNGIDRRHALALVKKAGFELGPEGSESPDAVLDQVIFELMSATETTQPLENLTSGSRDGQGPLLFAVVGPTGVGKTTTIAKLASEALLKRQLRVGLINLDGFKVAAVDQLGTYSRILNLPFRSVSNSDELKAALQDFQALDLVLIDTTGRSQRDLDSLQEMKTLLYSCERPIHVELMVSATTRDSELQETATRFQVFKPAGLMVSKLDEAQIFGSIYNLSQRAKLPLSYFTVGQRVPEDLEEATRERLAALIMDL